MPALTMIQALNLALTQEMATDDSVMVLGEDVGVDGGVFRVTEGLRKAFGEERALEHHSESREAYYAHTHRGSKGATRRGCVCSIPG